MRPIGSIAEAYCSGALDDDAAVALSHGPEELGYPPLTEPLVDVQPTLDKLYSLGLLSKAKHQHFWRAACRLHFKDRTDEAIFSGREASAALAAYREHRVNRKAEDALLLIAELRKCATVRSQGADIPQQSSLFAKQMLPELVSARMTALEPGDTVTAFLRRNPGFHPGRGRAPLILIGAGTGIGPLAGFVRGNARRRPIHLFFGMRHPDSDFFYGEEMPAWQEEGRLARLVTAVSRGARPHYVQDALRGDATEVARFIRDGARIMVCGGRDMAAGVADGLAEILAPTGLTPAILKAEGRYVEDVY